MKPNGGSHIVYGDEWTTVNQSQLVCEQAGLPNIFYGRSSMEIKLPLDRLWSEDQASQKLALSNQWRRVKERLKKGEAFLEYVTTCKQV